MITYTALMGAATGTALLLVALLGFSVYRGRVRELEGWALSFAGVGSLLVLLGGHMTIAWPLTDPAERHKNTLFGEPALLFGVLLLLAAWHLWRRGQALLSADRRAAVHRLLDVTQPVAALVLALGLVLAAGTAAAVRYRIFSTAPPQEPVYGTWPSLLNAALCALYGIGAAGALLAPVGVWCRNLRLLGAALLAWLLAGAGWLVLAALTVYTHVALVYNLRG